MNSLVKSFSKFSVLRASIVNVPKRTFSNNTLKDKETAEEKMFVDKNESKFFFY